MTGRSTVILLFLNAAIQLGEPPVGRLALVKWVFLSEIMRPLYELWHRAFEFVRYDHGPYSDDILRRTEFLVINGYATCTEFKKFPQGIRASYAISPRGGELASRLTEKFPEARLLAKLCEDLVWSLQSLGIRSANDICGVVYREPAFASILRQEGQGRQASTPIPIPTATNPNHPSFKLLNILSGLAETEFSHSTSPREIVYQYLKYLLVERVRIQSVLEV